MVLHVLSNSIRDLSQDSVHGRADKVISGIAIAILIYRFKLENALSTENLRNLLLLLQLGPDVEAQTCDAFDLVLVQFEDTMYKHTSSCQQSVCS